MPKNIQEERLMWVLPIINKDKRKDTLTVFPYSGRTLKRWLKTFREGGAGSLIPKSTEPKSQPNKTPIRIKEEMISIRKKEKVCAKKLHWKLKKKGLIVPVSTIGKIIKKD